MNVLLVVPWDQESGGVAAVVGYLAQHLQGEGHRALFLHPGSNERARRKTTKWGFDGIEMKLRVPFNPRFPVRSVISFLLTLPWTLFQLVRVLRANAIDVVNIHYPGEHFLYFALCRRLLPLRLVISIHGTDAVRWNAPPAEKSWPLRAILRAADLIVAPSSHFLRRCENLLAVSSARRLAIHNGTDVSELETAARDHSGATPFVLSVCSLDRWKGVDVLIRAIAKLRDRGDAPRLVVAGDGPERTRLERLIAELQLHDHVSLIGQQSRAEIARLLHDCTLFVLASRFETFGIAALEAMAVGKPVVGTKVDGILEMIEHGETGMLVEPECADDLADAIRVVLDDAALRARLGESARARVKQDFQRQRMGENYMHAFQELLTHGV